MYSSPDFSDDQLMASIVLFMCLSTLIFRPSEYFEANTRDHYNFITYLNVIELILAREIVYRRMVFS